MLWPGNNIGYFGPYESTLRGTNGRGHMASCGAGCTTLGIEADGAIKGCPSLQTQPWTGGNIRDASLRDIWERSAPLRYMRDRTVDDLWGFCRTCYYAEVCRAGCTWTAFSLFGKPGNNPLCHHRALEMHRHGLRERLVQVAPAPGAPFDHGHSRSSWRTSRHEHQSPLSLSRLQSPRHDRRGRLSVLPGGAACDAVRDDGAGGCCTAHV